MIAVKHDYKRLTLNSLAVLLSTQTVTFSNGMVINWEGIKMVQIVINARLHVGQRVWYLWNNERHSRHADWSFVGRERRV